MYLRTLKKDLKRQKTMNIILLLFTILASMFVSSGLSNVVSVINGTDYFMKKAGVGDYMIFTQKDDGGVEEILKHSSNVIDYKVENCYWASREDVLVNGKYADSLNDLLIIQKLQDTGINLFNKDNSRLETVNKGEVYVNIGFLEKNGLSVGDNIEFKLGNISKTFKVAGEVKDALFGSDMMGNTRLFISDEEFDEYEKDDKLKDYYGCMFYVNSDNVNKLTREVSEVRNVLFTGEYDLFKRSYIMEMITAMVVLVLSVCLVIVSFVLLKFVISFSITEEYREIGVMKAIGISNSKIRMLYIVKYMGISIVGGVIGFLAGVPLGKLMIASVSKKMYLGNDSGIILNIIGSLIVVLVMTTFVYMCTGKIKKATPVDAIRSGQTGERYKRRTAYSLKKSNVGTAFYMGLNDVLSSPRRFITIILSFFICSIFVFGLVEVTDTMKSDRLISTFGKKSDVYIVDNKFCKFSDMSRDGNERIEQNIKQMEEDLNDMGMPGRVSIDIWYNYPITFDGETISVTCQQNKQTKANVFEYTEGSAPQNDREIAITPIIAKKLGAHIGDRVSIDFEKEKRECIITAYFQTMNQLGEVVRLHEDAPTDMEYSSAMMAYQIDFDDKVGPKEISHRIENIKEYYDIDRVFNAADFCDDCMRVGDSMDAIAKLLFFITCIVVILTTVLMEKSFIQEEKDQIALLKAIGFSDSFVIKWHCIRFMIVAFIAELMTIILTYPVTKLWCDPIWNMMGAQHVDYYFKPFSLMVVYPGIILGITMISAYLTATGTTKIKSKDITNIE